MCCLHVLDGMEPLIWLAPLCVDVYVSFIMFCFVDIYQIASRLRSLHVQVWDTLAATW